MALTPTDLPDPVVPATSRWGILPRSATTGSPEMSWPSARVRGERDWSKAREDSTSRKFTISRSSLGISIPTTDLPGITSTTRTLITASERARSLARLDIRDTLIPAAGWISNRVITGPGYTATTSALMPKSASLSSSRRDMAASASSEKPLVGSLVSASSRPSAGNSPVTGASNKGCCFSFSARSLFSGRGFRGFIFGGLRCLLRSTCSSITALRASSAFSRWRRSRTWSSDARHQ